MRGSASWGVKIRSAPDDAHGTVGMAGDRSKREGGTTSKVRRGRALAAAVGAGSWPFSTWALG
jgi:hypothetical protein